MSENSEATENHVVESNTSDQTPASTETEHESHHKVEQQQQQPVTSTADLMTIMQAALASFDGLRVDAAIQVRKTIPHHVV